MKYLCIHQTAVNRNGTPQLFGVNRYHKQKWGMRSSLGWYVGYNEFVDEDGTRTKTRVAGEETVAAVGHNCDVEERCDTYHVCFAAGLEDLNPAQRKVLEEIKKEHPELEVVGHRDLQDNRTCPGAIIYESIKNPSEDDQKEQIEALQLKLIDLLRAKVRSLVAKLL